MKGLKYNLKFKKTDNTYENITNADMNTLIKNIKQLMLNEYSISDNMYNLNNQIIYNLINNRKSNKLLTNILTITKI